MTRNTYICKAEDLGSYPRGHLQFFFLIIVFEIKTPVSLLQAKPRFGSKFKKLINISKSCPNLIKGLKGLFRLFNSLYVPTIVFAAKLKVLNIFFTANSNKPGHSQKYATKLITQSYWLVSVCSC